MNSRSQSYVIYLLLFIAIIAMVVYNFSSSGNSQDVLTINEVAAGVENGTIKKIMVEDNNTVKLTYSDGSQKSSTKEPDTTLVSQLIALGVKPEQLTPDKVEVEVKPPSPWMGILTFLGYVLPFLVLGGAFFFIFRQAQGSNNAAMAFGKSKARMFSGEHPTVTFEDVAGIDESKDELKEVVEFL